MNPLACLTCLFASDTHAAHLGLGVVERFIDAVDRPNAGIYVGKLREPFVASFGLKDGAEHIHRLLSLCRAVWKMERQQFKMADARTEGMPEFIFQRCQRNMLAVLCLVNIVARETSIKGGVSGQWGLPRIQIGGGKKRKKRHDTLGHGDIDHASLTRLRSSKQGCQNTDHRHKTAATQVSELGCRHSWLPIRPPIDWQH